MGRELALHQKITIFYILILGISQISDKLYGFGFVAYMNLKHLNVFQISVILSFEDLAMAFFDYPSGNLSDLYGRKRIAGIGFLLWGLSLIVFGIANTFIAFMLSALIRSFGSALISGSSESWYIDELIRLEKSSYQKMLPQTRGAIILFSLIGVLMAGYLSKQNLYLPYIAAGVMALGIGIAALSLFQDNYGKVKENNFIKGIVENTRLFRNDPWMIIILLKRICGYIGYSIFILIWQLYAMKNIKVPYSQLGLFLFGMMMILSFSSFLAGYLMKVMKPIFISILGVILSVIGFGFVFSKATLMFFTIGIILYELGLGLDGAASSVWVHDYIESDRRASFLSALSSLEALSGFFIMLLVGLFIQKFSYQPSWLIAAVTQAMTLGVIIFFFRFSKKNRPPEGERVTVSDGA